MAFITINDKLFQDKRIQFVVEKTNCNEKEIVGILVKFWLYAINITDSSGYIPLDESDLPKQLDITKVTLNALIDAGFITKKDEKLYITNWEDLTEEYRRSVKRKKSGAERQKRFREKKKAERQSIKEEKQEIKQETKKEYGNITKKEIEYSKSVIGNITYSEKFEKFWSMYPKKYGKDVTYVTYSNRLKEGYTEDDLLGAVKEYNDYIKDNKTPMQYIMLPKNFLGDNPSKMPFKDYIVNTSSTCDIEDDNPFKEWMR